MHVHVTSVMALVTHDPEKAGAPVQLVEESNWQASPLPAESAKLRSPDHTNMGVRIDTRASEAEQIAMLADQAQE